MKNLFFVVIAIVFIVFVAFCVYCFLHKDSIIKVGSRQSEIKLLLKKRSLLEFKEKKRFRELQYEMSKINWDINECKITLFSRALILCIIKVRIDIDEINDDLIVLSAIDTQERIYKKYIEGRLTTRDMERIDANGPLSKEELNILKEAKLKGL